ncbi:NAD(P)-dependent oxidoreductase [Solimonas terrae]|uniref:NAD(P)-dependent oxidoreductase n=1 Tax=Solimonas terrae TaxID=1396819 RepID=A0A6M2BRM7_9GAMM|nr:NAD(P)-dependent oxidoreductase [Solimonas terrae]
MAIGFIGLGNIGKPMAQHLLKLDEPVWVCDVAAAPVAELVAAGANGAATPRALAAQCRVICLCVRDDADVESLLYGDEGLLATLASDAVIAIHSTVTQAALLRWAQDARMRGVHLIDAPISGGESGARAATLCTMVGADAALLERLRPVFATSASTIIHAGPIGCGIALKLCNNLMTYAAFAAIDEGLRLAQAAGLDPRLLIEVGRANGVVTRQMEAFVGNRDKLAAAGADTLRKMFGPFAALGRKDLAAALDSALALGVELPATAALHERIESVFLGDAKDSA